MGLFKKSGGPSGVPRAGSGYVVLNVIRAFNIIALLAVMAASIVMLVKTFVVSKFFFFDGVSHIITAFLARKYQSSSKLPTAPFPRPVKQQANIPPPQYS